MSPQVDSTPLFAEQNSGSLRLIGYLALAAALMTADYRSAALVAVRAQAQSLSAPAYWLATAPVRLARSLRDASAERLDLVKENAALREQLLRAQAGLTQSGPLQEENSRLRELLAARARLHLQAQLVELLEVDLGLFRHRLLLDRGSADGVAVGQAVMDAQGLIGQVSRSNLDHAEVILITDPGHAVPVRVVRNGLRAVAYGSGEVDRLELPYIPFSADIRAGDELVTSGLGGHFPAGIPVATITQVRGDDTATFAIAEAIPLAGLTRGNQVLLLSQIADPLVPIPSATSLPSTEPGPLP